MSIDVRGRNATITSREIDPLEGITDKSTKEELRRRLERTAAELVELQKQEEIGELLSVVLTATESEARDTVSYIRDMETEMGLDLIPVLIRLRRGLEVLLENT